MIQEQLTMAIAVGMMIIMMAVGYIAGRLTRIEKLCVKKQLSNLDEMPCDKRQLTYPGPGYTTIINESVAGQLSNIKIDDRKFVVDINTGGIEKKYDELGETKVSDENISSSVNKLKGMKK